MLKWTIDVNIVVLSFSHVSIRPVCLVLGFLQVAFGSRIDFSTTTGSYFVYDSPMTWQQGETTCVNEGYKLAIIETSTEKDAVAAEINGLSIR